ncbi:MAG TPA: sulfatase [Terriglobales bacterium]|jgi:N-acetylglucosamine-6-sulfatase|nr:sulfatase [Terriglobales bacterium]
MKTPRWGNISTYYTLITIICMACALGTNARAQGPMVTPARPNIVFILTDDFSMNLVQEMTQSKYHGLQDMMNEGTTFSNFFVSDSLCCPSRSSIFTGKFPHNTGVFTNTWAPAKGQTDGGFGAFMKNDDQKHTFALALHQAKPAYTTAMLGKYLNGYLPWDTEPYNKPNILKNGWGWDEWYVAGNGYPEFTYDLFQVPIPDPAGSVQHYGIDPENYMTDVLSGLAQDFIKRAKGPFFIEIATFAPHAPYRPAYRDETAFPGLQVPRTPTYDARPDAQAPDWMKDIPPLAQPEKDAMDDQFRLRAQCTLSIDKMISDIRATLRALGKDKNTYIFFSADNGYHMGDYSFLPGKMTPFDLDIRVPLVVTGPGVSHQTLSEITQTVDLAPTFTELGGNTAPTEPDGHSLVPLLHGKNPAWRQMALIEHHGPPDDASDPDNEKHEKSSGDANPPNYEALRSDTYMYVEYSNETRITSVSSTSTDATFMVKNNFIVVGTQVSIAGVSIPQFNLDNQVVTAATPTQFTIHGSFSPTASTATTGTVTAGKNGVSEYGYYNLDSGSTGYDPNELKNVFNSLPPATKTTLHDAVVTNTTCGETGKPTCWQAQQ